jgi:hypothetical protein
MMSLEAVAASSARNAAVLEDTEVGESAPLGRFDITSPEAFDLVQHRPQKANMVRSTVPKLSCARCRLKPVGEVHAKVEFASYSEARFSLEYPSCSPAEGAW